MLNHYHHSSEDISQPHWYSIMQQQEQQQQHQMEKEVVEINNEEMIPKMPLFEKSLTPSDVGKLNRLVIPKQCAEKYFPINGGVSNEKGLLLGFEDEVAKPWRFRYSYWNSSQSYVLTKGWSRFVKEKKLDAGDFVIFFRHRLDAGRLFIGWRRRDSAVAQAPSVGNGGRWGREVHCSTSGYPYPNSNSISQNNIQHLGSAMTTTTTSFPYPTNNTQELLQAQNTLTGLTASTNGGNTKRLRLFGVNLEYYQPDESEPSTPESSSMSSQSQALAHHHQHSYHSHMQDINFSGGGGDLLYRQR